MGELGQFVCLMGVGVGKKEGVVFLRGVDTTMPALIILSRLELLRIDLPK